MAGYEWGVVCACASRLDPRIPSNVTTAPMVHLWTRVDWRDFLYFFRTAQLEFW